MLNAAQTLVLSFFDPTKRQSIEYKSLFAPRGTPPRPGRPKGARGKDKRKAYAAFLDRYHAEQQARWEEEERRRNGTRY